MLSLSIVTIVAILKSFRTTFVLLLGIVLKFIYLFRTLPRHHCDHPNLGFSYQQKPYALAIVITSLGVDAFYLSIVFCNPSRLNLCLFVTVAIVLTIGSICGAIWTYKFLWTSVAVRLFVVPTILAVLLGHDLKSFL